MPCTHEYAPGIVLAPTARVHTDFILDAQGTAEILFGNPLPPAYRGHTISHGPGILTRCRKCIHCGHSIR